MKRVVLGFLILVLLGGFVWANDNVSTEYGRQEWISWSREEKLNFVLGFGAGVYSAVLPILRDYPEIGEYVMSLYTRISGFRAGRAVDIVDELYATRQYDDLPIIFLLVNVKEYGNGNS